MPYHVNLQQYAVTKALHDNARFCLLQAMHRTTGHAVLVKIPCQEFANAQTIERFRRDFQIGSCFNSGYIGRYLEMEVLPYGIAIVQEDYGYHSLLDRIPQTGLALDDFFLVAMQLVKAMQCIHAQGVIHHAISPSSVMLSSDSLRIKIIDFSLASSATYPFMPSLNNLVDLHYISPELTGRVKECVDFRSDFYLLGLTLYKLISGQEAFNSADPIELVHAHITEPAASVDYVREDIPVAVRDIIQMLLQKNPADRYQCCDDIIVALEQAMMQANYSKICVNVADKPLPKKLYFVDRLYGREATVAAFLGKAKHGLEQGVSVIFVSGPSGIGKSALIKKLRKSSIAESCHFVATKFNQITENSAYAAFKYGFQHLVEKILAENDDTVQFYRQKLLGALKANGKVIIDLIPEIEAIIGNQPDIEALEVQDREHRFHNTFCDFIRVFATREKPLIISLDDLQWADISSWHLLTHVLLTIRDATIIVVGTYRQDEIDGEHPLISFSAALQQAGISLSTLCLTELNSANIQHWLSHLLDCELIQCTELAEQVYQKTKGNPFFIKSFLQSLYQENILSMNAQQQWIYDFEAIKQKPATDNVTQLLHTRINQLSVRHKGILNILSCLGGTFELDILQRILPLPAVTIMANLTEIAELGFLLSTQGKYQFVHDRVREAVYLQISELDRGQMHLDIARLLCVGMEADSYNEILMYAVNHYNLATPLLVDRTEKLTVARANLIVACKAQESAAYQSAQVYLEIATACLPVDVWKMEYELAFDIFKARAENAYFTADLAVAERLSHFLLKKATTNLQRAEIYRMQLSQFIFSGRVAEAIGVAIKGLRILGIQVSKQPSFIVVWRKYHYLNWLLRFKNMTAGMMGEHEVINDETRLAFRILGKLFELAHNTGNIHLFLFLTIEKMLMAVKYGNSVERSEAYVLYASSLVHYYNKPKKGLEVGKLALRYSEHFISPNAESLVLHCYGLHIHAWHYHFRTVIPYLEKSILLGKSSGNLTFVAYTIVQLLFYEPFLDLKIPIAKMYAWVSEIDSIKFSYLGDSARLHCHFWLSLRDKTHDYFSLSGEDFDAEAYLISAQCNRYTSGIAYYHFCKLILYYTHENYSEALLHVHHMQAVGNALIGYIQGGLCDVYHFLILAGLYTTATVLEKSRIRYRLRQISKKVKKLAAAYPTNFLYFQLLINAEWARIDRDFYTASQLYAQATLNAQHNDYVYYQALASELAAKMRLESSLDKSASIYLIESISLYSQWGAVVKCSQLEEKHLKKMNFIGLFHKTYYQAYMRTMGVDPVPQKDLNLLAVINASQAISSELDVDKLIDTIMEIIVKSANVQHGFLIMEMAEKFVIRARYPRDEAQIFRQVTLEQASDLLAKSIVNFVIHTKRHYVFHKDEMADIFCDSYILQKNVISILCIPILRQDKLIAILYLESNIAATVFTHDRLETLKLLATQAAISLENSLYYQNTIEQKLRTHQLELAHFSRLAMTGEMASALAHEVNQPLSSIVQYIGGCIQKLREYPQVSPDIIAVMRTIEQQAEHAGAIIHRIKNFVRKEQASRVAVNVHELIEETLQLLQTKINDSKINVKYYFCAIPAVLFLDVIQMQQVFCNIMLNAIEAMTELEGEEPEIVITTAMAETDNEVFNITFSDNGPGVSQKILDQIFDPFFSTKKTGMGMGLSICRSIIEAHHGKMIIRRIMPHGAEFIVSIPCAAPLTSSGESQRIHFAEAE